MLDDWDERDEVVAAGSICPVPRLRRMWFPIGQQTAQDATMPKSWCEFACALRNRVHRP